LEDGSQNDDEEGDDDPEDHRSINPELTVIDKSKDLMNVHHFQYYQNKPNHKPNNWVKAVMMYKEKFKCSICGLSDNSKFKKTLRIAIPCVANDHDNEPMDWQTKHTDKISCRTAVHVGCARWGNNPEKLQRLYYHPAVGEMDEMAMAYCDRHAKDVDDKFKKRKKAEKQKAEIAQTDDLAKRITSLAAPSMPITAKPKKAVAKESLIASRSVLSEARISAVNKSTKPPKIIDPDLTGKSPISQTKNLKATIKLPGVDLLRQALSVGSPTSSKTKKKIMAKRKITGMSTLPSLEKEAPTKEMKLKRTAAASKPFSASTSASLASASRPSTSTAVAPKPLPVSRFPIPKKKGGRYSRLDSNDGRNQLDRTDAAPVNIIGRAKLGKARDQVAHQRSKGDNNLEVLSNAIINDCLHIKDKTERRKRLTGARSAWKRKLLDLNSDDFKRLWKEAKERLQEAIEQEEEEAIVKVSMPLPAVRPPITEERRKRISSERNVGAGNSLKRRKPGSISDDHSGGDGDIQMNKTIVTEEDEFKDAMNNRWSDLLFVHPNYEGSKKYAFGEWDSLDEFPFVPKHQSNTTTESLNE
jgi:hypothetical protein